MVKFIPRYFILFDAIISTITFLISSAPTGSFFIYSKSLLKFSLYSSSQGQGASFDHSLNSLDFPGGSDSKESACNAGDLGSFPGLGRSSGEENSYPLQYSGLENSIDRGSWWAIVHGVTKTTDRISLHLNSLSERLLISISLRSFSEVLSWF